MGKAAKGSWFAKGKEGAEKSKRLDEEAKVRRESQGPRRFWLENDSSAHFTLLDTPAFFCHEHNLKLGGKFHNYFTCIQEIDTCPICESGDNPSFVLVGTIINHKSFEGKDGKVYKNQKQLIVFKAKAKEKILRQIEKKENLKFTIWEASRGSSSTECSTGEDFEYQGKWGEDKFEPAKLKAMVPDKTDVKEWLSPFNYEEIFAPKDADELRKVVGGSAPVGGKADLDDLESDKGSKKGGKGDDDDPFFNDGDGDGEKGKGEDDDEKPKKAEKGGKAGKGGKKGGKSDDDVSLEDLL